jgi:diguanylate cyclase (GGDEF)-like protein/putative nucleotidyltransferase with HDIG domain
MALGWALWQHQGPWSLWALLPVTAGISLLDRKLSTAFLDKSFRLHQLVLGAALLFLDPSTAVLVTIVILVSDVILASFRQKKVCLPRIFESIPALGSAWVAGLWFQHLSPSLAFLRVLSPHFPALLGLAAYLLLHQWISLLIRPERGAGVFFTRWEEEFLKVNLLFGCVWASLVLADHFSAQAGEFVFLSLLPLAILVVLFERYHARQRREETSRQQAKAQMHTALIEALAQAIDAKYRTSHGHARRVAIYSLGIARRLGISNEDELQALRTAALLHDIGELAIPDYLLSKPGKLTDAEYSRITRHAEIGANLLEPIEFPHPIVSLVRHHHEHIDGSGYPYGLRGEEIPLGARILAVAEAFDALIACRPYKKAVSGPEALALLLQETGKSFDPEVMDAFSGVVESLLREAMPAEPSEEQPSPLSQPLPASPEELKLWLRKKSIEEIASVQKEIFTLYEIFQAVGSSLNLDDTLRVICQKLQTLIPFSSCVIYLKDLKTDNSSAAVAIGEYADVLRRNWIGPGEGASGYAMAFNRPVVNSHPGSDFTNLSLLERPDELVNSLIFPLQSQETVLGAIAVYSTNRQQLYSDDHIRLMEVVSNQAAVSIQNALAYEAYERNSLTDPLTGLPNSRYMFLAFEQNIKKADRFKEKMAVLVMDLNEFKRVNDQHGHRVGDEVLIEVSRVLQNEMRKYDTCIRYGGDEFVAFLYNAGRSTAEIVMDRIKQAVLGMCFKSRSGEEIRLGISVGMSLYPDDGSELSHLFTVADSQMYRDKYEGRNFEPLPDRSKLLEAIDLGDDFRFQQIL